MGGGEGVEPSALYRGHSSSGAALHGSPGDTEYSTPVERELKAGLVARDRLGSEAADAFAC